jgi:S1/P1 Nuclease
LAAARGAHGDCVATSVRRGLCLVAVGTLAAAVAGPALAWGPVGHRIAGDLAEQKLCPAARDKVKSLGGGESLAEIGSWADEIRDEPKWKSSRPWHYMNIADLPPGTGLAEARVAIDKFVHPRDGDVLEALARFSKVLADPKKPRDERAEALRFVVHFVADIHQPLHVGRASDHGGNDVEVRVGKREPVSLHHFWDTEVLPSKHPSAKYLRRLESDLAALPVERANDPPAEWAAESLALRATIYGFRVESHGPATLDDGYVHSAQKIADERLVLAGARLAATLNTMFCGSAAR